MTVNYKCQCTHCEARNNYFDIAGWLLIFVSLLTTKTFHTIHTLKTITMK